MQFHRIVPACLAITLIHCYSDRESHVALQHGRVPGIAHVWAVHDGEKIEKDDLAHPARASNTAWDGSTVKLFGARNEVIAFQLVVESEGAGVRGLDVSLPALRQRGGGAAVVYAPPGDDPSESLGRPIQIFTENYMLVTEPSRARWVFEPGGPAAPRDATGWKPVQLVPENARAGRGGLPIDVAPRQNQALWFDIYIPGDLPAGMYDGAIELRVGHAVEIVPVEMEVFPFVLPDDNSLTAMVYFEPDQVVRYQGRGLEARYHRFAHRHRIELVNRYTMTSAEAARGRFDGSDFTAGHGYEGPGAGTGNRVVPASFYGAGAEYNDPVRAGQAADAWMSYVATRLPHARTFLYAMDEPTPAQYERIRRISRNVKNSPGIGRTLPILVTSAYAAALDGAVDIWCSFPGNYRPEQAADERGKGRDYWFYNGYRPATGALTIDTPATDARVNAWAAFKHDVDVYFYWHANHWRHNSQIVGERNQDIWANPVTFDNRGQPGKPIADQGFIHGDGVLVYPGEEILHPEHDRGIAGPISTIQLANLRRGVQDHLYLTMARDRGLDDEVEAALARVVPRVFARPGAAVGFAEQGDEFEAVRYMLAQAIMMAD
jgi:hypothetical protein